MDERLSENKQGQKSKKKWESEELYRRIVETTIEGIWVIDGQYRTTFVNGRMAEMLGFTTEEMLGKDIASFVFSEDMPSHRAQMSIRRQGQESVYERRFRCRNGSELWTLVKAQALKDNEGGFIGSFAMLSDISDRKQAELSIKRAFGELKAERDMMQRYLDTADTLIVALNSSGHVIMINRYGLEMLGYAEHEIVGRNWFKKILPQPEGKEQVLPVFQAIMRGELEQSAYHENEVLTASGLRRQIAWRNTYLVDEWGKPNGTLSSGMDITAHKEAEKKYRRLQKAESLRRMAGAIAHHFNNQLQVIMGNIEMATQEIPLGSMAARALAEAMDSAAKAVNLSTTMLTYLGHSFSEHQGCYLRELCLEAIGSIQSVLPGNVELQTDLPAPGPKVKADAEQIKHLAGKLIQNSIEAIGDKSGTLQIAANTWVAEGLPPGERFPGDWQPQDVQYACLTVRDNGCGIASADIERLFDPFFTSKMTGRGLGLPEALGIARAHDGGIWVDSEPGRGSTFRVLLPLLL